MNADKSEEFRAKKKISKILCARLRRKRKVDIWTNFCYTDIENKTQCLILSEGKECGHKIKGKNTTKETYCGSPQRRHYQGKSTKIW